MVELSLLNCQKSFCIVFKEFLITEILSSQRTLENPGPLVGVFKKQIVSSCSNEKEHLQFR